MLNSQPLAGWAVFAPDGFTATGKIHKFQQGTVERLQAQANEIASAALADLLRGVEETYQQGEGTLASTLQYTITADRTGVVVQFSAGGRHLVYLTALAGEPEASPGHFITGHRRNGLTFYWKDPPSNMGSPGVYSMPQVWWRTRFGRDVLSEVLSDHAVRFEQDMLAAHDRALVEFLQEGYTPVGKSLRASAY
jgi:hypothetical protein